MCACGLGGGCLIFDGWCGVGVSGVKTEEVRVDVVCNCPCFLGLSACRLFFDLMMLTSNILRLCGGAGWGVYACVFPQGQEERVQIW